MLEQKVFSVWRKLLGVPLGEKTVPVSISSGVLKVYTEYPPYKKELLLLKERIMADLNAELGQPILTDIRIDVRQSLTSSSPHTTAPPTRVESTNPIPKNTRYVPTPETLEQIEQTVVDVTDTDLKTSLRQLFASQSTDKS